MTPKKGENDRNKRSGTRELEEPQISDWIKEIIKFIVKIAIAISIMVEIVQDNSPEPLKQDTETTDADYNTEDEGRNIKELTQLMAILNAVIGGIAVTRLVLPSSASLSIQIIATVAFISFFGLIYILIAKS